MWSPFHILLIYFDGTGKLGDGPLCRTRHPDMMRAGIKRKDWWSTNGMLHRGMYLYLYQVTAPSISWSDSFHFPLFHFGFQRVVNRGCSSTRAWSVQSASCTPYGMVGNCTSYVEKTGSRSSSLPSARGNLSHTIFALLIHCSYISICLHIETVYSIYLTILFHSTKWQVKASRTWTGFFPWPRLSRMVRMRPAAKKCSTLFAMSLIPSSRQKIRYRESCFT